MSDEAPSDDEAGRTDRSGETGGSVGSPESPENAEIGTVYLVGSGPGDPDLLTVKARRLLDGADAVLHDKLPGPEIIDLVPEDRREDVGKRAGGERTSQADINDRLVELAREGKTVVRLKGGDPFVFGRGGEEAEHLASEGVPFEVVPGITSAVGGPGVAGIPVTHRDHASSVSFVTGHEDPTKEEAAVDWAALAATGGTIVVLMGVGKLPDYARALREAGMDPETPVALVERATRPGMRVARGTLSTIVDVRDATGIEPPALTVIGEVAASREKLRGYLRNGGIDAAADGAGDPSAGGRAGAPDGPGGGASESRGDEGEGDGESGGDRSDGTDGERGGTDG